MSWTSNLALSARVIPICLAAARPVGAADAGPDAGYDPEEVWLERARECYHKIVSLTADFVQEQRHGIDHPSSEPMRGVAMIKKGGLVRLEYKKPAPRLLIADGATVWAFDPASRTAFRSGYRDSLLASVFALVGGETDQAGFEVRRLGGEDPVALELIPRARHPLVASIVLTLERSCPCIKRVMVVDHAGSLIRVTLENIKINARIGARKFRFAPPSGTRVVSP